MSISFKGAGGGDTHESYEQHVYVQTDAPAAEDGLAVGDVWSDTTNSLLKRCTSVSPVTFVSTEGGSSAHDVFSATHGDAATDTVARGDIVVGDATPELTLLTIGSADEVVKSDGTDAAWSTVGHDELSDVAADDHHDQAHAADHADGGADEVAVQDLATDAATDGQIFRADGSGAVEADDDIATLVFVIDGGGSAISTGVHGGFPVDFNCDIVRQATLADQTGSIVVDIWKEAYADLPPTDADSITASAPPTISSGVKDEDETLTGWTTAIAAGDWLYFNVDSVTTVTRCTVALKVKKRKD